MEINFNAIIVSPYQVGIAKRDETNGDKGVVRSVGVSCGGAGSARSYFRAKGGVRVVPIESAATELHVGYSLEHGHMQ